MRILLTGDSITDMSRTKNGDNVGAFGYGYPSFIQGELAYKTPTEHTLFNRGISGNRVVDIYARIKVDCWNLEPDLISILIGVNDVWHEAANKNGVEIDRYERVYRAYIEDTLKVLPKVKFMLLEPFVLKGSATEEKYAEFLAVKEYAKVVKGLAKEYGATFVPLQDRFDKLAEEYGVEYWLYDGVHPTEAGARLIAEEWLKAFNEKIL